MRAIEISTPGTPDVLQLVERPVPELADGEVLIKVAAAGVNRPDVMQRLGRYPPPPGVTDIPGLEVAGTVAKVSPGVTTITPGLEVCALLAGGGYAEYCAAPASQCARVPKGLTLLQAAAVPETFCTVWTNVFGRARLSAAESLLVHGGASGIGTAAIQLAHAFGARVFATAGTDAKCRACEQLGAELAVNYRTEDWPAVVRARTEGRGVDVVLDMVGGDYTPRNLDLLAPEGRLVQIAFLRGPRAEIDFMQVMHKRLTITGSTLRPRSALEKGAIVHALQTHVWPLIEAGRVKPIVHAIFPLERAADAHRMMEAGAHTGKIVLDIEHQ